MYLFIIVTLGEVPTSNFFFFFEALNETLGNSKKTRQHQIQRKKKEKRKRARSVDQSLLPLACGSEEIKVLKLGGGKMENKKKREKMGGRINCLEDRVFTVK